jgi:hypothetical protein
MATRDKDQVLIYNQKQLELIKAVFADNEELIYIVRKVLLQFPLTDFETKMVKSSITPEVYEILRMRLLPDVNGDSPLTQLGDLYQSLNNDLKTKSVAEMAPLFAAKKIEIDYLTQQFEVLKDIEAPVKIKIVLDDLKYITEDAEETYVKTIARNFLLSYVDSFLNLIKNLAGTKAETAEEQEKRLKRDSSK